MVRPRRNNLCSEIPVDFDGDVLRARNAAADRDVVDERFDDRTGEVRQMGVLLDELAAVVAGSLLLLDFVQLLLRLGNQLLHAAALGGEVVRQLDVVALGQQTLDLVEIQLPDAFGVLGGFLPVERYIGEQTGFLRGEAVLKRNAPFKLVLVEVFRR